MTDRRTVTMDLTDLKTALREAIKEGIKECTKDPEIQAMVGESMYNSLVKYGSKDAKIWVGGKVIAGLATLLLAAAITLYVRYGPK